MPTSKSISIKRKYIYTVCPTRYRTRHFFNNSNTNEDIATKFEQEYEGCVRNEKNVSVVSASNFVAILISGKIIKEMPGSVVSGTHCILRIYILKLHR